MVRDRLRRLLATFGSQWLCTAARPRSRLARFAMMPTLQMRTPTVPDVS